MCFPKPEPYNGYGRRSQEAACRHRRRSDLAVRAAMDGSFTSRTHGRGGLGLRTVRDITAAHKGYVTVRSESAAVTDWGKRVQNFSNLAYMAGTHVSVKLSARPTP